MTQLQKSTGADKTQFQLIPIVKLNVSTKFNSRVHWLDHAFLRIDFDSFPRYSVGFWLPIYLRFSHLLYLDQALRCSSGGNGLHQDYSVDQVFLRLEGAPL